MMLFNPRLVKSQSTKAVGCEAAAIQLALYSVVPSLEGRSLEGR